MPQKRDATFITVSDTNFWPTWANAICQAYYDQNNDKVPGLTLKGLQDFLKT